MKFNYYYLLLFLKTENSFKKTLGISKEGKEIASNMINGYKELNENISQTMNLISDIQNASKEQLLGIEQINDEICLNFFASSKPLTNFIKQLLSEREREV